MSNAGRPNNPTIWSSGLPNYPAGALAWSATPVVVTPAYNYFTPNTAAGAQEMNAVLNDQSQKQSDFFDWMGAMPALNWPYRPASMATVYRGAATWLPGLEQWVLSITNAGPTPDLYTSPDGTAWTSTLGYTGTTGAGNWISVLLATSSQYLVVAEYKFSTLNSRIALRSSGGVWSYSAYSYPFFESGCVFNGVPILAAPANGAAGYVDVYTASNTVAASWTNTLHFAAATDVVTSVRLAASPTKVILVSALTHTGTPRVWTSTDGSTWVQNTLSVVGNADFVSALTYDAVNGLFVMTVINNTSAYPVHDGTTPSRIYTSPDGLTWTLKATLASHIISGVICAGSLWVAVESQGFGRTGLVSTDLGVTWRVVKNLVLGTDTVSATGAYGEQVRRPTMAFSGSQLLSFNGTDAVCGLIAGLPDAVS